MKITQECCMLFYANLKINTQQNTNVRLLTSHLTSYPSKDLILQEQNDPLLKHLQYLRILCISFLSIGLNIAFMIKQNTSSTATYHPSHKLSKQGLNTPIHKQTSVGRLTKTFIQELCSETKYRVEDLPWVMNDREREPKEICTSGA